MTCGKIDLHCTLCRLSKGRTQVVPGVGPCSAKIAFVGEGPGKDEDLKGEPFVGRAGRVLDEALERSGADRKKVYITNLVKCRPPGNRRPRKDEVETCSVYLKSELGAVKPIVICALGQTVAKSLLGKNLKMSSLINREWSVERFGNEARLIVAYHPAACLYQRKNLKAFRKSVDDALQAAGVV